MSAVARPEARVVCDRTKSPRQRRPQGPRWRRGSSWENLFATGRQGCRGRSRRCFRYSCAMGGEKTMTRCLGWDGWHDKPRGLVMSAMMCTVELRATWESRSMRALSSVNWPAEQRKTSSTRLAQVSGDFRRRCEVETRAAIRKKSRATMQPSRLQRGERRRWRRRGSNGPQLGRPEEVSPIGQVRGHDGVVVWRRGRKE